MTRRNLVSTEWLEDHLNAPDVVVLDATYHLPNQNRDPRAEYAAAHIPGALFFDIDAITDPASVLPHMMPPAHVFASAMRKLGIGDGQTIVAYDTHGLFSAARAWWSFRAMGVDRVFVLDGGLPKWRAEGRAIADSPRVAPERHFTARLNHSLIRDAGDIRDIIERRHAQIVDARSLARFEAREPEPRAGLKSGHMPGARCVPFTSLLDDSKCLKPNDELEAIFREAGVDLASPIVTSCGSGVTAAVLSLALSELGVRDCALYDGSWTEWGALEDAAVAAGPAD